MTTTNISDLPYGYPKEITAWVDSFISHDPALRSNTQIIILQILCHDKASKSARELFPKLMEDENWPENFTTFIEKVAEISINMPKYFYTPKQFLD